MTEPSPIEIQYSKDQATSQEVQKKKKSSKKKAEPKPVNPRIETVEGAIPNLHTEADFDLIHYTYKLEQQLATVKRQVKQQKQKFRQVIHGLAKYFDERGVSSQAIEEYVQNLGTQIAENQDRESDYEKFFTVHKYHIVEDPTTFGAKSLPKVGQKAENGPKNTPKEISTSVKLDTSEPTQADLTVSDKGDKPEKKKGRPSTKAANGNGTTAEEAPKKRKYTKHKQSDEGIINIAPDIQEIPPLEFPKKPENKVKKAEDAIRGYEEINQKPIDLSSMMGQPTFGIDDGLKAVVKQMGIDPAALMNPYMAGAFGVQEGDIYNKLFQELMKASSPNPMLNTDKARQELFNYYQGNFK